MEISKIAKNFWPVEIGGKIWLELINAWAVVNNGEYDLPEEYREDWEFLYQQAKIFKEENGYYY